MSSRASPTMVCKPRNTALLPVVAIACCDDSAHAQNMQMQTHISHHVASASAEVSACNDAASAVSYCPSCHVMSLRPARPAYLQSNRCNHSVQIMLSSEHFQLPIKPDSHQAQARQPP